ncbi:MAG: phosphoadenylyl-sulfate reductase [Myxococcota bacterium]|nr:phosphoadenylyl-sulfate reductase [Myxococcota bacterium]
MAVRSIWTTQCQTPPNAGEINELNQGFEKSSAEEILTWATTVFAPRITFSTALGIEGCVLVDMIARGNLAIDIFTVDTGLFFPETYALWEKLEKQYKLKIGAARSNVSLERQAELHGPRLYDRAPNQCCQLRKILPLEKELKGFDAWITSLRRSQSRTRAHSPILAYDRRYEIYKLNPLANWSEESVTDYIKSHGVPYNVLHERNYPSIGCQPCTTSVAPGEDSRAGRWRGEAKTECGIHFDETAGGFTRPQTLKGTKAGVK